MRFGHGVGDRSVTYLDFDQPHHWACTSTSRRLDVRLEGAVEPIGERSRLVVRTGLLLRGPLRPVAPLLRRYVSWVWNRNLAVVKSQLENREEGIPMRVTAAAGSSRAPAPRRNHGSACASRRGWESRSRS
jgi:hypothetical protein